ncbi:MAG: hypothetical protein KFW21_01050 [Spirochaetota bacterium]|nr:hypothetical protein [Spirochaetota bacterium]
MFIEIAKSFMEKSEILNETIETIIIMILIPSFWILRGIAIFGLMYPIMRVLFITKVSPQLIWKYNFAIFWLIANILILWSSIDLYWKWVWVDVIGVFIAITTLFSWNSDIIHEQYKKRSYSKIK